MSEMATFTEQHCDSFSSGTRPTFLGQDTEPHAASDASIYVSVCVIEKTALGSL